VIVSFDAERVGSTTDLRLILGLDAQPALAVLDLADAAGAGTNLQLRLLEAGHQVVFHTPDDRISETITRLPGHQDLSGAVEHEIAGRLYRFQGELANSPRMVNDLVHLYAQAWTEQPHALRGIFSGNVKAIAEVQLELRGCPKRLTWAAVHTYPAVGQVLRTKSSVTVTPGAARG
jgi:hypothetical protein